MDALHLIQINFPMCTIAHTPRLPEHCIEYVRVLLWPQEHPFGGEYTAQSVVTAGVFYLQGFCFQVL